MAQTLFPMVVRKLLARKPDGFGDAAGAELTGVDADVKSTLDPEAEPQVKSEEMSISFDSQSQTSSDLEERLTGNSAGASSFTLDHQQPIANSSFPTLAEALLARNAGSQSSSTSTASSIAGTSSATLAAEPFANDPPGSNFSITRGRILEKKDIENWLANLPASRVRTHAQIEAEIKLAAQRKSHAHTSALKIKAREEKNKKAGTTPTNLRVLEIDGENALVGVDMSEDSEFPHMPDVPEEDMFNPVINPIAELWFRPDAQDNMDISDEDITPLDPFDPNLPRFHTDPAMPFAPWLVANLPPFRAERVNRAIEVPRRFVAAVGMLYPEATFVIAQRPASQNPAHRFTGAAMAKMMAVNFPELMMPDHQPDTNNHVVTDNLGNNLTNGTHHGGAPEPTYIISLRRRDWPSGAVATVPDTPAIRGLFDSIKSAFDVMPNGAEVWFYVGTNTPTHSQQEPAATGSAGNTATDTNNNPAGGDSASTLKTVSIFRAYEGVKGPQPNKVVHDWAVASRRAAGGQPWGMMPREDDIGKQVLTFMGEAWVAPDRWSKPRPRAAAGGRKKKNNNEKKKAGGERKGTKKNKKKEEEPHEDEWDEVEDSEYEDEELDE